MTSSCPSASTLQALRITLLAAVGIPLGCGETSHNEASEADSGGSNTSNSGGSGGSLGTGGFGDGVAVTVGGPVTTVGSTGSVLPLGLCSNPRERLVEGVPTGFYGCDEGYEVRRYQAVCPNLLPPKGEGGMAGSPGAGGFFGDAHECSTDADCPGELDYCQDTADFGTYCLHGCTTDADCGAGKICRCDAPIGHCSEATCTTNVDCGPESLCASVEYDICSIIYEYACLREDDECRSDSDCMSQYESCQLDGPLRTCGYPADCGRPFLVDEQQRFAAAALREDWVEAVAPHLDGLTDATLAKLSQHWQQLGLLEHASIAAFARFSLQLLQLGAPAELIERTNQALVDETRHARLAFALASAYGGRPIGPGPLDTADALRANDLEHVVSTVILEGCVGETVATVQAQVAHDSCLDPTVRQVLGAIAAEEARHAELAWRFLRWVLEQHPHLETFVQERFDAVFCGFELERRGENGSDLTSHGVLPTVELSKLRAKTLTEVIKPCALALLAQKSPIGPDGYSDFMYSTRSPTSAADS